MGRPKHVRVMAGALEGDIFIGPKAEVRTPVRCTSPYISVRCCKGGMWQLNYGSLVLCRSEEQSRLSLMCVCLRWSGKLHEILVPIC